MKNLISVSMNEVINFANSVGSSFFSKSNLNSFDNTRIFTEAIFSKNSYYFVTANRMAGDKVDGYTIRRIDSLGNMKVLGALCGFKSYDLAMRRLNACLSK